MEATECVLTRKSVRAYKAIPVPKELLTKILDEAKRSPSCANTQPWEFNVFEGKVMEEMRRVYREPCMRSPLLRSSGHSIYIRNDGAVQGGRTESCSLLFRSISGKSI